MKPIDEVTERIKFNDEEIQNWTKELKRVQGNYGDFRDEGYISHCREIISSLQAENSALKWAYNL